MHQIVICSAFVFLAASLFQISLAEVHCPVNSQGTQLTCAVACCVSNQGKEVGYYCCGADDFKWERNQAGYSSHGVATVHTTAFHWDWSLLLLGIIISIVLSVLLSLLCCLLCNGCWLHRRRNPHMYATTENVHGEHGGGPGPYHDGFYEICCGFGIPVGTIVFSTQPPHFASHPPGEGYYGPGSAASTVGTTVGGKPPGSPQPTQDHGGRVRWNDDGTPKSVLKQPEPVPDYNRP